MFLTYFTIPLLLAGMAAIYLWKSKRKIPEGSVEPPKVKNCLPYVGHGLSFSKDIIGFIKNAYQEYGKVFKMKIFRTNFVVICDDNMKKDFFKATEDNISLYKRLEDLYFDNAFSDDITSLPLTIQIIKRSTKIRYDEVAPKIMIESNRMIEGMKKESNG